MSTAEERIDAALHIFLAQWMGKQFGVDPSTVIDAGLSSNPRGWVVLCCKCVSSPERMAHPARTVPHVDLQYALTVGDSRKGMVHYLVLSGKCPRCGTLHYAKVRKVTNAK